MSLLITCPRNLESKAEKEIFQILDEFGDNTKISKNHYSGIIEIEIRLELIEILEKIREKISNEPWELRYCARIIPIQKKCESNLEFIKQNVIELITCIKPNDSYKISLEKRDSKLIRNEIIANIANLLPNKVSLENPDWEILIQILGTETGISVMPEKSVLSVSKIKRLD